MFARARTPCLVPRGYQKNPFLAVVSATPDAQQRILSPALRHETAFQRMQAPAAAKRHRTKLSFSASCLSAKPRCLVPDSRPDASPTLPATAQSPLEGPPPRLMQDFIELKVRGLLRSLPPTYPPHCVLTRAPAPPDTGEGCLL